ncbi:MAG: hypothetical protein Q8Q49_02685, partial [bacterium]|nr:hypothetical protein [bacterium]
PFGELRMILSISKDQIPNQLIGNWYLFEIVMEIIPGILEQSWEEIERKLAIIKQFSRTVHIDILDGKFAPNTTFLDPNPFTKYKDDLFFELHMMVEEPIDYLEPWAKAGFKRFIGQVEKMEDQIAFVAKAQTLGEVGLAVDAKTDPSAITVDFEDLDFLFVMTVHAGFSHQSFLPECLNKVRYFRSKSDLPIEVDGGINDKTVVDGVKAGATRFVSTGFLFKSNNPKGRYETLVSKIQG